jgi:hypothetical protein
MRVAILGFLGIEQSVAVSKCHRNSRFGSRRQSNARPDPRELESIALSKLYWMPAFAGMTRKIATADRPLL